ncbi:hypothetical protein WKK05_01155 [Nostoc sp. UHCC 0302]|uniref:hypothetical protein n=1 Tax=Nostoc sp. UHCC 0302 TaxID=3134896 RepID=UPI00311C8B8F
MSSSVEGIYRNGRVELTEQLTDVEEGIRVIVTFMKTNEINLASQEINQAQAEILRGNLATFADDWDSPEMSIYDNYDAAKTNLEAG